MYDRCVELILSNIVVSIDPTLLDSTLFDCLSYPFIEQFLLNQMLDEV